MKKLIVFLAICHLPSAICLVKSQDYRFTQAYANPLRLNPAIMGANSDLRAGLGYRTQWSSIEKGFTTMYFSGMYPLYMKSGGKLDVGVSAINDKAGAFKTTDLALAVDYNREIAADQNLCLALMGGIGQKSLDANNLTYESQYVLGSYSSSNPSNEVVLNNKASYPDVGFGLVWYMNPSRDKSKLNAFAGVSGFHLNKPNQSFTGVKGTLPVRMTYIGGVKILGEKKVDVSPNVRMTQQAGNTEMSAGVSVDYNLNENMKAVIGAWYRRSDAIAFMVGVEHKMFTFGYSYDAVTSTLNAVAGRAAAHEITLSYKMSRKPKSASSSLDTDTKGKSGSTVGEKQNPFHTF
ncbi:MAG: PorP/SprF family type IX secretion system membrane protein [Bacteroidetes bacterium]|nr:PorP/SprF family type IX secretion system membrane protein [Bacteroidota bacterium]